jgi:hypothetical protein
LASLGEANPLYLLYVDEAGDPYSWQEHKHFVLGGFAVHEGQIYGLVNQLSKIQEAYFPGVNIPIAFHATDIQLGKGVFRDLHLDRRKQLLDDICQCISQSKFPNLIVFATAINVTAVQSGDQALRDTFQDVCQRFNTFLVRQFKAERPSKGLLIIDQAHEGRYRQLIADFQRTGTEYGYLGNIVDIPYFARRRDTRMLQLADFCAHIVFRYYESNDVDYFTKILPRFDRRTPQGPPDGLKHITENQCSCEACGWR